MVRLARAVGFDRHAAAHQLPGLPGLPPGLPRGAQAYLDGHVPELCENCRRRMRHQPAAGPRLQGGRLPAGGRSGAPDARDLCEACARALRRVRTGLEAAGGSPTRSTPPGARPRLLHPHRLRVAAPRASAPRTPSAAAAATTGWWSPWAGRRFRPSVSPPGWIASCCG